MGAFISKNSNLRYIDSVGLIHRMPELKHKSRHNYAPHNQLDTAELCAYHPECSGHSTSGSGWNLMPDHLFWIQNIHYAVTNLLEISEGSPLYFFLTLVTWVTIDFLPSNIKFTICSLLLFYLIYRQI